jgi:hypothetical protein
MTIRNHSHRFGLMALLLALASANAFADSNPFAGVTAATTTVKTIGTAVGTVLGGTVTLIGGSIAGWKASHGESFTKPLLFAIVAAVIAGVSIASW